MEINVNVKVEKDITLNLLHKAVSHFVKQLDFLAKEDGYAFTIEDNNRMIANYKSKKFKGCSYDFIVQMEVEDRLKIKVQSLRKFVEQFNKDCCSNLFTQAEKERYSNGRLQDINNLNEYIAFSFDLELIEGYGYNQLMLEMKDIENILYFSMND